MRSLIIAAGILLAGASAARAQDRDTVLVEQIAGRDVYVPVGASRGLAVGDTVVASSLDGQALGLLRVTHTSRQRAILTFAGAPFPVTRGQRLLLQWHAAEAVASLRARTAPRSSPPSRSPRRRTIGQTGRLTIQATELRSSTIGLGGLNTVGRRLTTTTAHLRSLTTGLPGETQLSIRARATGRFTPTGDPVRTAAQFYEAAVQSSRARGFGFALGRFQNPYGGFGEYWDGILLRAGSERVVVGGAAGFEPYRGNETFSPTWRKVRAFLSVQAGTRQTRYTLDADAGRVWSDAETHLQVAASQSLRVGVVRWFQRVRVDRAEGGAWRLTNLQGDLHVRVARNVTLISRISHRQQEWRPGMIRVDSTEYLRLGGGMRVSRGAGSVSVEWSGARTEQAWLSTMTTSANLARLPGLRAVGLDVSGQYWSGALRHGIHGRAGLRWQSRTVRVRSGFTYYQTTLRDITVVSRSVDFSTSFTLAPRIDVRMVATGQFGAFTRAATVTSSLSLRW